MAKTLGELLPGESGVISAVGGADARIKRRLVDMGITPLTRILLRKTAPLGDPIEVHLRGYDLSLRREDALSIALFDPAEEEAALARARAEDRLRMKRAEALLSGHKAQSDRPAHERAMRLTEWAVSVQGEPIRTSPSPCEGCPRRERRRAKGQSHRAPKGPCGPNQNERRAVKLALVGNPNSGKTTLFNAMTGSREYVGNWPGVTVEKKEGRLRAHGQEMLLVDLPGIYSLSPYSLEEVIARNYIIEEQPDAIINIVDGTNLERNLYLTVQLMELERPMVLALNMMDEVEKSGDRIDVGRLSLELGIPVVPISARTGEGVNELLKQCELLVDIIHEQVHCRNFIEPDDVYDDVTHAAHHKIGEIADDYAVKAGIPAHWAQMKLLESDALILEQLQLPPSAREEIDRVIQAYAGADERFDSGMRVAESRYRFISRVISAALTKKRGMEDRSISDRIDAVLTHKYFALPVFLLIMLLIFLLTFGSVGSWLSDQVETLIGEALSPWLRGWLTSMDTSGWLVSLICDGIITGVGGVLTFLPQIALLFLCLSILEDSGYLSRTAFIMDKPLKRIGLSGKSFIPMLMGFGCTVPAAMSARTMENEKDRRMTIFLLPFMSCSAKLPVYGLIAGAFFGRGSGMVVFALYALGMLFGVLTGLVFKRTLFRGADAPFVMEMPPYRRPQLKNTLQHVGERVEHFLEKAGTIILVMSILLWVLQTFDFRFAMVENAANSILGTLGGFLAPALKPLGFGSWQAAVSLLTGFVAKEAVVASLSLFYGFSAGAAEGAVRTALSSTFTPLSAFSFLVFVLLYVPCMAAVATMRRELSSGKWTAFMVVYQIAIAYIAALFVYQLGLLFGL